MNVQIANPIYDVVFKYMMEDNAVAKLLVSSIIGEEVIYLEPKPQEKTTDKDNMNDERTSLTVYRLDFSATIKVPDGHKLITIEMQKASFPTDIMRFRRYLGKQYTDANNSVTDEDGNIEPLQIYAIYFLGKDLEICDTPVLSIFPDIRDVATQQIVEAKSGFIESLNHKCWVIQISCLKKRRRNELEQFLSVFDQTNLTSDHHILNVREEDFPEKYRSVIRRLKMAASSQEIKKQMQEEDEVVKYLQSIERSALRKGEEEARKKMEKVMTQKEKALKAKDKAIENERNKSKEKDKALKAKDKTIEDERNIIKEKDKALQEKDKTISENKKIIEALQLKLKQAGLK